MSEYQYSLFSTLSSSLEGSTAGSNDVCEILVHLFLHLVIVDFHLQHSVVFHSVQDHLQLNVGDRQQHQCHATANSMLILIIVDSRVDHREGQACSGFYVAKLAIILAIDMVKLFRASLKFLGATFYPASLSDVGICKYPSQIYIRSSVT